MKTLPIRTRLTAWYALSLTLLLAAFGFLVESLMHARLLDRTDFELQEELNELAMEVELAPSSEDLLPQLDLRFGHHMSFEFVVQSVAGIPVFTSQRITDVNEALPPCRSGPGDDYRAVSLTGLGNCRVGTRTVKGPSGPLSIAVVSPMGRYIAELDDLRSLLLTVGPLVILVAIAGGFWLARRALHPIDQMTRTASRIGAETGQERLQIVNADDELGRLAATLNGMLDRLERSMSDMRQFTADAAHELRTPLAVIRSTAEVALRSPRSSPYYEDCLQTVVEESDRLTAISNQLLMLAREDAGLGADAMDAIDLADVVVQTVVDLEPLAEQKGLELTVSGFGPLRVLGDPTRLRRVLTNLIENAVKYTPGGGRVAVSLEKRDTNVMVSVCDTGIGIPAEHLPFVFDRFYRVESSHNRETGGTGLGLAICRSIVKSHRGSLSIQSELGKGTAVRVNLPASPQSQERPEVQSILSAG